MISPELQMKISEWRRKVADDTITQDELREAVAALRESRMAASVASRTAKAKVAIPSADDLLDELGGL